MQKSRSKLSAKYMKLQLELLQSLTFDGASLPLATRAIKLCVASYQRAKAFLRDSKKLTAEEQAHWTSVKQYTLALLIEAEENFRRLLAEAEAEDEMPNMRHALAAYEAIGLAAVALQDEEKLDEAEQLPDGDAPLEISAERLRELEQIMQEL